MRVLLLVTARDEGGAERMAECLVRTLAGRCTFTVVVPTAASVAALADRLAAHARVVRLPLERATALPGVVAAVRRLARDADVVHLNSNHPASRLGVILSAAVAGLVPLVSVEQQASSPSAVELPHGFGRWAGLAFRLSRRRASAIVSVSAENSRRLSQEYRIDAARIVTVYNGIDVGRFDISPERRLARRRELSLSPEARVVVVAARQAPIKGHRFIVAAAPIVLRVEPRARFVLVGARDATVAEQIRREQLEPQFLDLGFLPHGLAADTVAACDVLALPSLAEGFSVVLLEGMAAGVVPVATAVGGAAELICDGENGFLVPPAEPQALARALIRALQLPPDTRSAMVARARARASEFSIDRTAEGMLEVYRQAATGGGFGPAVS